MTKDMQLKKEINAFFASLTPSFVHLSLSFSPSHILHDRPERVGEILQLCLVAYGL